MLAGEQFLSYAQHERALVHPPNDREVLGPNPVLLRRAGRLFRLVSVVVGLETHSLSPISFPIPSKVGKALP
jgi:hypothetical protein